MILSGISLFLFVLFLLLLCPSLWRFALNVSSSLFFLLLKSIKRLYISIFFSLIFFFPYLTHFNRASENIIHSLSVIWYSSFIVMLRSFVRRLSTGNVDDYVKHEANESKEKTFYSTAEKKVSVFVIRAVVVVVIDDDFFSLYTARLGYSVSVCVCMHIVARLSFVIAVCFCMNGERGNKLFFLMICLCTSKTKYIFVCIGSNQQPYMLWHSSSFSYCLQPSSVQFSSINNICRYPFLVLLCYFIHAHRLPM